MMCTPGKSAHNLWQSVIVGIWDVPFLTLILHNLRYGWVVYKGDGWEQVVLYLEVQPSRDEVANPADRMSG